MDHACYAVTFVEGGGIRFHDCAGEVAADYFGRRQGHGGVFVCKGLLLALLG